MNDYDTKINENFKFIYGYLNNEYGINLTDDIEEYKTENVDYSMNNLPDKMYFGSKNKLTQLKEEKLFLSPYIGIASIFIVDRNNIIREMMKEQLGEYPKHYTGNIGYKEWDSLSNDELKEPLKFVHMTHNYIDLKGKKTGESKGYIYEIDISNIKDKLKLFVTKNANREVIYTGKEPLIPNRIIHHTIKWSIEFDEDNYNKHGKGIFEKNIENELDWITNFVESDYFRENTINKDLELLSNYEGELYFVSELEFPDQIIKPKLYTNNFTKMGYEDSTIKHICFSSSIDNCITAMGRDIKKGMQFNIYSPDDIGKYKIYKPNKNLVPDAKFTNEMWILENVKIIKLGSIIMTDDKMFKKFEENENNGYLYGWKYKWTTDFRKSKIFRYENSKTSIRELNREDVTNPYFVRWFFKEKDFQDMEPEQFNFDILIHDGNTNFSYGCFIDNKLEGIIRLIKHDEYFEISMLYVDMDVFNHGIGQYLLEHTLNKFKNEKLRLNVYEWNKKSRYIYEKYGFKIISEFINKDEKQYMGDKMYVMERIPSNTFTEASLIYNMESMTYHNPNKDQALNELYLREKDILNCLQQSEIRYSDEKSELNNLRIIRNDIETIENGKYSLDIMKKYRDYNEAVDSGLSGKQTWHYNTYMDCRPSVSKIERFDIDEELTKLFSEAIITDEPKDDQSEEPKPEEKTEEKPKSDKNGVNRKKLYIAFIEYAKSYNMKNSFGSLFDKDIFRVTYSFIPDELRFFYRIANPILCVLENDLTFFQVSELKKINQKNHELTKMIIFAATQTELVVFNREDKKVYKGLEDKGKIVLQNVLGSTFDLYIQNMIDRGDILNEK